MPGSLHRTNQAFYGGSMAAVMRKVRAALRLSWSFAFFHPI